MVAGQALDLEAESREVNGDELETIHQQKTGALIRAAACCGALIARVTDDELEAIASYATNLGLLFQITDDLLDVTATAEDLGKTPGKDARARKATFPALYGIEEARGRVKLVHRATCDALKNITFPTSLLNSIANYILRRES